MHISYYIDDFLVFSFFLSNWILVSYIRFIIRSSQTPRSSSWHCRCCSQLAPSHYQKIMTRHMTLDDQLNSTLQFTYLILDTNKPCAFIGIHTFVHVFVAYLGHTVFFSTISCARLLILHVDFFSNMLKNMTYICTFYAIVIFILFCAISDNLFFFFLLY